MTEDTSSDTTAPNINKILQVLGWLYDLANNGLPSLPDPINIPLVGSVSTKWFSDKISGNWENANELAKGYFERSQDPEVALSALVSRQIAYITSGTALLNMGGVITMPISLPSNILMTTTLQLRMLEAIAHLRGYDPRTDEVRTTIYLCLCGKKAATEMLKGVGVQVANKITKNMIESLSSEVIKRINSAIGYRFLTKFGATGTINLVNWIPFVAGGVAGTIDYAMTRAMVKAAMLYFPKNEEEETVPFFYFEDAS